MHFAASSAFLALSLILVGLQVVQVTAVDNSPMIVPLHSQAGTGLIQTSIENATIDCMGPRMYNALLENTLDAPPTAGPGTDVAAKISVRCILKCGMEVATEVPCIYKAIRTGNIGEIFKCGYGKKQICDCVKCLPDPLENWINGHLCRAADVAEVAPTTELAKVNLNDLPDLNIKSFLGTTTEHEIETVKALGYCPGERCGECPCCLGVCAFGQCLGYCVL